MMRIEVLRCHGTVRIFDEGGESHKVKDSNRCSILKFATKNIGTSTLGSKISRAQSRNADIITG